MKNFDNNARTIPVETTSYSYKHLNKDDTLKMRIDVKNAILRLTNIDQKQYEDYDAYFTISGSAANDTIIRILMNKSNESLRNKILTTNVEHLSTMRVAMYFDRNIVDVVNKSYDGHDTKDARFAHFIVANNESGIIYTSMLDYIAKNRGQIPIVSADTIQCLGKTRTIDYNLFDIFTFTSQKLFCEAGISGFIFNTKRVPLADPTMMLSQHLCANLISGVEYLLSGPDPDEYFKDLTTYTFDKIRDVASSKELELLILIDDIGSYVDQKTNEPFDISQDIDDETVIVIVYRDLKEGQLYNTILMSLYMVFDNQLYIIETCKAVQEAIKRNFILSKSSFCGQDIKYLNVLGVHPLIAAKGTLRISYHIDTKKTDIDELIIYIADNLAGPAPDQGAVPVEELAEFAQAPTE